MIVILNNYYAFESTFSKVWNKHPLFQEIKIKGQPCSLHDRSELETKYFKNKTQESLFFYKSKKAFIANFIKMK